MTVSDVQLNNSMWCKEKQFPTRNVPGIPHKVDKIDGVRPLEKGACVRLKFK